MNKLPWVSFLVTLSPLSALFMPRWKFKFLYVFFDSIPAVVLVVLLGMILSIIYLRSKNKTKLPVTISILSLIIGVGLLIMIFISVFLVNHQQDV